MAASDLPAEAVEAARVALWEAAAVSSEYAARQALVAAAPHIRAQVLAEVDAALRDETRYREWWVSHPDKVGGRTRAIVADYLRDTLGGDHGG
jgi:hypothetical protein